MAEDSLNIKVTMEDLYSKGLSVMQNKYAQAAVAIGGSLALVGKAMQGVVVEAAAISSELFKWSEITGVNVRELSKLRDIVLLSGGATDDLFDSIKELGVRMKEAQDGVGPLFDNLKHLRLEFQDQSGQLRDTGEVYKELVVALGEMENKTLRAAIADELFGDVGTKLLPVLISNKDAIANLTEETENFNGVITEESAQAAKDFNRNIASMERASENLRVTIGNSLIPTCNSLFDIIKDDLTTIDKSITDRAALIRFIELEEKAIASLADERESGLRVGATRLIQIRAEEGRRRGLIRRLKEQLSVVKELKEATEQEGLVAATRIPGGRGDVATREAIGARQEQAAVETAVFLQSFHAQLNADLRAQEQTNQALDEELRQQAIDREIEQMNEAFEIEYESQVEQNERLGFLGLERQEAERKFREDSLKETLQIERLKIGAAQNSASAMVSILQGLSAISQGQHESQFEALRVARIAQATVDTYAGINKAFADPSIPYYASWAAALAIGAAGFANVASIGSTSFSGGGSSSPSLSAPSQPTAVSSVPIDNSGLSDQPRAPNVTVNVFSPMGNEDWDEIATNNMLPAFERANINNIQTTFP